MVHLGLLLAVLSQGGLEQERLRRIHVQFNPRTPERPVSSPIQEAPRPKPPTPLPRLPEDPPPAVPPAIPATDAPELPNNALRRLRQGFQSAPKPGAEAADSGTSPERTKPGKPGTETRAEPGTETVGEAPQAGLNTEPTGTGSAAGPVGQPGGTSALSKSGPAAPAGAAQGFPEGDPFAGVGSLGAKRRDDVQQTARWRQQVGAHLQHHKRYPDSALELGIEGKVLLDFNVDCQGVLLDLRNLTPEADQSLVQAAKDALKDAVTRTPNPQTPVLEVSLAASCSVPGAASPADCRRSPENLPRPLLDTAASLALKDCATNLAADAQPPAWCLRRYRLTVSYRFQNGQFLPDPASVPEVWRPALEASARQLALPCTALRLRLPVLFRIDD